MNSSHSGRSLFWLLVCCILLPVAASRAQTDGAKDLLRKPVKDVPPRQKQALIIGAGAYRKANPLRATVNDAKKFKEFLVNSWGFAEDHVTLMTDDAANPNLVPTFTNLVEQTELLVKGASADSEVVLFFSGHGVREKDQDYLVPLDGSPNSIAQTCISVTEFNNRLQSKTPRRALLFIDACRDLVEGKGLGGNQFGAGMQPPPLPQQAALYSCQPGEQSREGKGFPNGVFTHFLLQGLGGDTQAANPDGAITFESLLQYVRTKVQFYVAHEFGASQSPLGSTTYGSMVLARAFAPPMPMPMPGPGGGEDAKAQAERLIQRAYQLLLAKKPIDAVNLAKEAAKLDPDNAHAHYIQGCVYLESNQPQEALRELTAAKERTAELPGLEERLKEAEKRCNPNTPTGATAAERAKEAEQKLQAGDAMRAEILANLVLFVATDATKADRALALSVLGRIYEGKKENDRALKAYQEAVEQQPDLKPAVDGLERLRRLQLKADTQAKVNEAIRLVEAGNNTDAELRAREVLSVEPDNARCHYVLGRVYLTQNRLDMAKQEFETALKQDASVADAAQRLKDVSQRLEERRLSSLAAQADQLLQQKDYDGAAAKALDVLNRKSNNQPANALAHFVMARVYEAQGKLPDALREYQETIRLEPSRTEARTAIDRVANLIGKEDINRLVADAVQALQQGKTGEAESKARQVIARAPDNAQAHYVLGQVYAQGSRVDEAIQEYQEAQRLNPALPDVAQALQEVRGRRNRGEAKRLADAAYDHLAHREFLDAAAKARKAIELDAANAKAHGVLSNALLWVDDAAAADREMEAASRLDGSLALTFVAKGVRTLLTAKRRIQDAIRDKKPQQAKDAGPLLADAEGSFTRAISLQPNELLAHNNLASVYNIRYQIGGPDAQLDLAEKELRKALELDPDYAVAFYNLGLVYVQKGQWRPAEDSFRKAIQRYPDNGIFYAGLGSALLGQGKVREARAEAERAKSMGVREGDHILFSDLKAKKK